LADHDSTNKSEKATPERRKKAREEGQFARGRDAGGIAAGLGVLLVVTALGSTMLDSFRKFAIGCFHEPFDLYHGNPTGAYERLGSVLVLMIFPMAVAAAVAATIIGFAEAGFHPRLELLSPKWSRLNPFEKLKRMISPRTAIAEMTLAIARVAVVGWVAYATLRDALPTLLRLARAGLLGASAELGHTVSNLTLRSTAALAVLAGADYIQNRLRLEKELRMSRQEIKEEYKQSEGDPRLKHKMRARAKERLKRGLVKQVKSADVVVANPTHVSAALRYRPEEGAPVLQAKGFDDVALHIQRVARENGIPVIESPALARAIVARVRVGKPIPVDLYAAVAQVLAFVYRMKRKAPWSA
jgi:flagellar biosynthetic protein FlhB